MTQHRLARRLALPLVLVVTAAMAPAAHGAVGPRIIGGDVAPPGSWLSIAALVTHGDPDANTGTFCGGTLVAQEWVLTAAHCTEGETAAGIDVVLGRHTLSDSGVGERIPVAAIHQDPGYNQTGNTDNDVSLLRLSSPSVQPPMSLVGPGLESLWKPGTMAAIAGWGNTRTTPPADYPDDLRQATVPVVGDDECLALYGAAGQTVLPGEMLCAGYVGFGEIDACQGDSGGPLVVRDTGGRPVLVGDTSWGNACADPRYPGVYGRLASLRGFVDSVIGWTPGAAANVTGLSFPEAAVGAASAAQTVTIRSSGDAPLSLAGVHVAGADAGQFRIASDDCSQSSLLPGDTCQVAVQMTPFRSGMLRARLAVDSDDAHAGAADVALTGAAPPLGPPASVPLGAVTPPPAPATPPPLPEPAPRPNAPSPAPGPRTPAPVRSGARAPILVLSRHLALRVSRHGRVAVRLHCRGTAGHCAGRIVMRARGRRSGLIARSARFSLHAGRSVTVRVRLRRWARRVVRRRGDLAALVTARGIAARRIEVVLLARRRNP